MCALVICSILWNWNGNQLAVYIKYHFWWLRLALSKGPNRIGFSLTWGQKQIQFSLVCFLIPGRWIKSENPISLKVIHHRQNPIVTTLCSSSHALLISLTFNSKRFQVTDYATADTWRPPINCTPTGAGIPNLPEHLMKYNEYGALTSQSPWYPLHNPGDAMRGLGRSARYFRYLTDNEHTVTSTWCSTCAQPGERSLLQTRLTHITPNL
jgi:hypothetical protein